MLPLLAFSIPIFLSVSGSSISDIRKLCRRATSCTECTNLHPACAWCLNWNMTTHYHCDMESELLKRYGPNQVYRPQNRVKYLVDHPIGSPDDRDPSIKLQMQPQRVHLSIKPNSDYRVKFTYMHLSPNQKHLILRSSSISKDHGMTIAFSIMCHGREVQGMQCSDVSVGEIIEFYVNVRLLECRGGNESLSIGAYGYDGVNALYIKELCGCECEEIDELRKGFLSPNCNRRGDLNCGECVCQNGYGGNQCQCPLNGGLKADLLNFCKQGPNSEICSGNGICECGKCKCQAAHIQGNFCECDSLSCPTIDGKICGGRGRCNCGVCECETGFTGNDCSCSLDKLLCMEGDMECNGHGKCECGICKCDYGYSGHTCGISNDGYETTEFYQETNEQQSKIFDTTVEPTYDVHLMTTSSDLLNENSIETTNNVEEDYIQNTERQISSTEIPIEILDHHDIDHTTKVEKDEEISKDNDKPGHQLQQKDSPDAAIRYSLSSVVTIFIFFNSFFVLFYFIRSE